MGILYDDMLNFMKTHNKTQDDVLYVNHRRGSCSFNELAELIKKFAGNYVGYHYPSYILIGDTWTIEFKTIWRDEYYSEWIFKKSPTKKPYMKPKLYHVCTYQRDLSAVPIPSPCESSDSDSDD